MTYFKAMVPYKCQLVIAGDLNINVGDPTARIHLVCSIYWLVSSVLSGSPAWHRSVVERWITSSLAWRYLRSVRCSSPRLVLRKRKFDPISADIRDRLHWLPIRSRIYSKPGILVYKCLHGIAPHTSRRCLYWNQLFRPSPAFARWREAIFVCREQKQERLGHEASPLLGPALWNKLPDDLRDTSLSLPVFNQRLQSYLFKTMLMCDIA